MWLFFNPTIKVVTFRLRGWCVLGVFLLPAFTRLGHEHQDLLSPCDEMHVCTDMTLVYTLIRRSFLGEWSLNPCELQGKNPLYRKCPQRRIEPVTLWTASPSTTNWAIPAPVVWCDSITDPVSALWSARDLSCCWSCISSVMCFYHWVGHPLYPNRSFPSSVFCSLYDISLSMSP